MATNEEWRVIPMFHGMYDVSSFGRIRRSDTKRLRKTPVAKNGYPVFSVYGDLFDPPKEKKMYPVAVHVCVAKAFIPNPDNLPCINHADGSKTNNKVDNLEWCTQAENMRHAGMMGFCKGSNHKPVLQIKDGVVVAEYKSVGEASRQTGIHASAIGNVANHRVKKDGAHYYTAGGFEWEFRDAPK